jgi:hypothetical protein
MAQTREEALEGVANQVEVLQAVINGLPRIAEAIAPLPPMSGQSALELGYSDSDACDWVTAIMFSLRAQVHATSAGNANIDVTSHRLPDRQKTPEICDLP